MGNTFDDFVNAIRIDPQKRNKINDMLDRYDRLPCNYQSTIGYDSLIQNVILKELLNIMGTTITDLDIEVKRKISRIKYLESKLLFQKKWNIKRIIFTNEYNYYNIKMDEICIIVQYKLLEHKQKYGADYHRSVRVECFAELLDKTKNEIIIITIRSCNINDVLSKVMISSESTTTYMNFLYIN